MHFILHCIVVLNLFSSMLSFVSPWIVRKTTSLSETADILEMQNPFNVLSGNDLADYKRSWAALISFMIFNTVTAMGLFSSSKVKNHVAGIVFGAFQLAMSIIAWGVYFPAICKFFPNFLPVAYGPVFLMMCTITSLTAMIWHVILKCSGDLDSDQIRKMRYKDVISRYIR